MIVSTPLLVKHGITQVVVDSIKSVIKKIPWHLRRQSMGEIAVNMLNGNTRLAESIFGWSRVTVKLGMNEFRTGLRCHNDISKRRRLKTEEKYPRLIIDIHKLLENECHADPQLRTTLAYTDITASAVRKALLANGWTEEILPTLRTISNILNSHRYRLRRVEKYKIQKRTDFTDPIFKNVHKVNAEADDDPTIC